MLKAAEIPGSVLMPGLSSVLVFIKEHSGTPLSTADNFQDFYEIVFTYYVGLNKP